MTPKKPLVEADLVSDAPSRISHSQKGMALVIVLAVLVLLAGLVVAFFSTVTSDASSSAVSSNDARAKQLADSAVNLVMGQIVEATKGFKAAGNTDANRLAWASQPGAIRTYDTSGNAFQVFKLYSSPTMVGSGTLTFSSDLPTSSDATAIGAGNHALFTDLNSPVADAVNQTVFPIADPAAIGPIQGFTATSNATIGVTVVPGNSSTRRLPMPTRWLYMLKDGTLAAATGNSSTATVTGATATNPIVGRVAFWTDDETSKVNINTASGAPWDYTTTSVTTSWGGALTTRTPANFWDTPIIGSPQDVNLAISQPWQGEFQRYPGHPATVSLSAVLPGLTTREAIESLAPRVRGRKSGDPPASSEGGSYVADSGSQTTTVQTAYKLTPDGDRLYASVDELLFAAANRPTANAPLSAQDVKQAGFFLTASSRAPEVTLFNTPRLVMWPVNTQSTKQTAYDKLIAFCGTVGPVKTIASNNSYYFTRQDPDSATTDYNLARNQQLLTYFRNLSQKAVPGFGGASGILGKYGADREQITTEVFDYIRCINTQDSSTANSAIYYAPKGTIMPTAGTGNTRGFGRFPTVTKAGMMFWFDKNIPATGTPTGVNLCARLLLESFIASHGHPSPISSTALANSTYRYQITGLSSLKWGPNPDGTGATNIFPSDTATNIIPGGGLHGRPHGSRLSVSGITGTTSGITNTTSPAFALPPTAPAPDTRTLYFSGGVITIEVMGGGSSPYVNQTININLPAMTNLPFPKDTTVPDAVCTNGPGAGSPTTMSWNGHQSWQWAYTATQGTRIGFSWSSFVFRPQDAVRSVGVTHGDFRLVAANPNVPSSVFSPVTDYGNPGINVVHNFLGEYPYTPIGARFPAQNYYNTTNNQFSNQAYPNQFIPPQPGAPATAVPNVYNRGTNDHFIWVNGDAIQHGTSTYGPSMAAAVTGDFDNGYGAAGDGPFIGFADEGNARIYTFSYTVGGPILNSIPYLDGSGAPILPSKGFFSPNRLVPSAGIMGSLPTGVKSQTPWQTLLFRPKALTSSSHPGLNTPPDYLLLDLFNMPVVEPYAISEPLSTAGRVNMNYQILPFTYIKRSTAVQAALHTEWLTAIPNSQIGSHTRKTTGIPASTTRNSRWPLNLSDTTGTLKGFEDRFASNDIFRSASEICSIPLVPTNSTWSAVTGGSFWPNYSLTGDNSKERPYARIYPKLTTKSNSFTVHFRVQVLKKNPNTAPDVWDESKDIVSSEYRGSTLIERYIDPNNTSIPDFATNTSANIDDYYRFRVIQTRRFAP